MRLFLLLVLLLVPFVSGVSDSFSYTTENGWGVTWNLLDDSTNQKLYKVDVQNLILVNRDFNLTGLIQDFPVDASIGMWEWKTIEYIVPRTNVTNNETYDESVFINEWKKTQNPTVRQGVSIKSEYGSILIPKFGSKDKTDSFGNVETTNGTKYFLIEVSDIFLVNYVGTLGILEENSGSFFHPVISSDAFEFDADSDVVSGTCYSHNNGSMVRPYEEGLVGYYTLDGTNANAIGGSSVSISGASYATGKLGQGLADTNWAANEYFTIPALTNWSQEFTACIWLYNYDRLSDSSIGYVSATNGVGLLFTDTTQPVGGRYTVGDWCEPSCATVRGNAFGFSDGGEMFWCWAFDGANTCSIYEAGTLGTNSGSDPATGTCNPGNQTTITVGSTKFKGVTDEIALYQKNIGATRIGELYASGSPTNSTRPYVESCQDNSSTFNTGNNFGSFVVNCTKTSGVNITLIVEDEVFYDVTCNAEYSLSAGNPTDGNTTYNLTYTLNDTRQYFENFTMNFSLSNEPPSATTPTLLTSPLYTNISGNWTFNVSDPNGDSANVTAIFRVDGVNNVNQSWLDVANGTTLYAFLDSSNYTKNQTVNITIELTDGTDTNTSTSQSTVYNYLPVFSVSNLTINYTGVENESLVDVDASDGDGDTLSYVLDVDSLGKLSVNSSNGNITFSSGLNSSDIGVHNVTLNVSDGQNVTQHSFVLTVVDDVNPSVTITAPSGTITSRIGISLVHSVSDGVGLGVCWYRVETSVGNQEVGNTSVVCNGSTSFTVSADGDYIAYVFANDTVDNVGSGSSSFTVDNVGSGSSSSSSSSSTPVIIYSGVNKTPIIEISTINGLGRYDLFMSLGEIRELDVNIENLGDVEQFVNLSCGGSTFDTGVDVLKGVDFCDLVELSSSSFVLVGGERKVVGMSVVMPVEAAFGDRVTFSLVVVNGVGDRGSLVTEIVVSRFAFLRNFFVKWRQVYRVGVLPIPKLFVFVLLGLLLGLLGYLVPSERSSKNLVFTLLFFVGFLLSAGFLP